jgi:hypothetical protein
MINTDFTSHHIEGIAREGNTPFNVPLITEIDHNFWQGGCINGVSLAGKFKHIVSLYPWEQFNPGGELDSFTAVRLYDSGDVPNSDQLYALATWVNVCRELGPTLLHCQAGLNRSGLVAGLALVLHGMSPKDAIAKLCASRCPAVLCNKAFENWLLKQKP